MSQPSSQDQVLPKPLTVVSEPEPRPGARRVSPRARRALKLALLSVVALGVAVACWRWVPPLLAWLADASAVRAFVAEHAYASRAALVGINALQIVLAFLPGEPVELAFGYAFGFWEGTALCLLASALASTVIFWAVRRWGKPLVDRLFGQKYFDRFGWLRDENRLGLVMLVVFLIPGTPKDFLTYFAGLTRMRFAPVLAIATLGRIPSVVTSTFVASAAGDGNLALAAAGVVATGLLMVAGVVAWRVLGSRRSA